MRWVYCFTWNLLIYNYWMLLGSLVQQGVVLVALLMLQGVVFCVGETVLHKVSLPNPTPITSQYRGTVAWGP